MKRTNINTLFLCFRSEETRWARSRSFSDLLKIYQKLLFSTGSIGNIINRRLYALHTPGETMTIYSIQRPKL